MREGRADGGDVLADEDGMWQYTAVLENPTGYKGTTDP
jgi:hypothetical protein